MAVAAASSLVAGLDAVAAHEVPALADEAPATTAGADGFAGEELVAAPAGLVGGRVSEQRNEEKREKLDRSRHRMCFFFEFLLAAVK